jgi:hypothetical protein
MSVLPRENNEIKESSKPSIISPFDELKSRFKKIQNEKSETLDFLSNRVDENQKLLESLRPTKTIDPNTSFLSRYLPTAIFNAKRAGATLMVACSIPLVIAFLPVLVPVLAISEKDRKNFGNLVNYFNPEMRSPEKEPIYTVQAGILGSGDNSIFSSDREKSLKQLSFVGTFSDNENYIGKQEDLAKMKELKEGSIPKPNEIEELQAKINIKIKQHGIKILINELKKYQSQELGSIQKNFKFGDSLVIKGEAKEAPQVLTRTRSFSKTLRSFGSLRSSDSSADLETKRIKSIKRSNSSSFLSSMEPDQKILFTSTSRTQEQIIEIQNKIKEIDDGYSKKIDKLEQANRVLNMQLSSLGSNIREYNEFTQKEKNVTDLKTLLNSQELKKEDILKKYDKIIGDIPATSPRTNSFQPMRSRSKSDSSLSADPSQNKNKNDLFDKLTDVEKENLNGIIKERMKEQEPLQRSSSVRLVSRGSALDAFHRSSGGARPPNGVTSR